MEPVGLLQELLRANTVNPPGGEDAVVEVLEGRLSGTGLGVEVLRSPAGRPTLIARVDGPRDAPAIVLLSHSDVVPVEEEAWTHDPFGGELHDGCIWGRGALDMKSITAMHVCAATELARASARPRREVIVVVAADEEAGGREGTRWLIGQHADRLGFGERRSAPEVLTEGAYGLSGLFPHPVVPIALGEKSAVWFDVVAHGEPGHGALPPQRQSLVALASAVGSIAGFGRPRVHDVMREQFGVLAAAATGPDAAVLRALSSPVNRVVAPVVAALLRKRGVLGMLLSDSITPTQVVGGYKSNVVPGEARASFDARLLPDTDIDAFIRAVDEKARRRGARVDKVVRSDHGPVSGKGPLFAVLERASRDLVAQALPTVSLSPGITDARFFRARGAAAYGWCPLVLTPELLATIHGHDERIPVEDFRRAVAVTTDVVMQAAAASR